MGNTVSSFSQDPSRWGREGKQGSKGGGGEQGKEMPSEGLAWGCSAFGSRGLEERSASSLDHWGPGVLAGSLWAQERPHQQK